MPRPTTGSSALARQGGERLTGRAPPGTLGAVPHVDAQYSLPLEDPELSDQAPTLPGGQSPRADRPADDRARAGAMTATEDGGGTGRQPLVSPAADATARGRWRALVLTDPIHKLVRNAAHAGVDDDLYDLRRLAMAAVDLAVASMGFAREATLEEVVDALAGLAARMQPGEEHAPRWRDIAQLVVKGLLNDPHEQRRFSYTFADLTDPGAVRFDTYSFRLLSLRDTEYGPVLVASDQAVMLFLDGLDVDIEDAEAALAHVLQRQLDDERFDAAVRTAAMAERTSLGMSAMLTDLLDATSRDVRSHDWLIDVPERLGRARKHVAGRISEDDRTLEHVQNGLDGEVSAAVRAASGQIVDLLRRAKNIHLDLHDRLVGARDVFLTAQVRQRLARRRRLRLLALGEELFTPTLALASQDATTVVETFADRALGVRVPRLARFDDMVDLLWAPPRQREVAEPEVEDPGDEDTTEDVQRYPEAVLRAARDVLAATRTAPTRLSALLDAAAAIDPTTVDGAVGDVVELVLLSALWAFAPDLSGDDEEQAGEVDLLAVGLAAGDDGTALAHPLACGADLLVTALPPDQPTAEMAAAVPSEGGR